MARLALAEREFILEQLERVPVKVPIYTCANGHYTDESKKCPSCKSKVIRSTFLEELLQRSTFSCPHKGCGKIIQGQMLSDHAEHKCHYRPVLCPLDACQREITFWTYFAHLEHGHHVKGDRSKEVFTCILLTPIENRTTLNYKIWNDHTFVIWARSTPTETCLWVQYYGHEEVEKEFVATVSLHGKKPHKTEIQFPVTSIQASFESVQRKAAFAHLSTPALTKYMTGELLRVFVSVQSIFQITADGIYRLNSRDDDVKNESDC